MTYEEWKEANGIAPMIDRGAPFDPAKSAWNAAIEEAAKLMEARNVSASEFYGREIRALKET